MSITLETVLVEALRYCNLEDTAENRLALDDVANEMLEFREGQSSNITVSSEGYSGGSQTYREDYPAYVYKALQMHRHVRFV